jgi:hypothetical protein
MPDSQKRNERDQHYNDDTANPNKPTSRIFPNLLISLAFDISYFNSATMAKLKQIFDRPNHANTFQGDTDAAQMPLNEKDRIQ